MATANPVVAKKTGLKTTGKDIARVYLYTTKTNDIYLKREAKKQKISKSTLLDRIITDVRRGKLVSPTV